MATATRKPRATKQPRARIARLVLTIGDVPYTVRPAPLADLPHWALRGFTLTRHDAKLGRVRHLIAAGPRTSGCSCGDSRYRQSPVACDCKHLAAARACGLL